MDKLYYLIREQGMPNLYLISHHHNSLLLEERLRTLEKENRRLSETVLSTVDDLQIWRSSHQTLVRCRLFSHCHPYNSTYRLKAARSRDNLPLSGHSMTSLLVRPQNLKCLIHLIHHPTGSSMISLIGHTPMHRASMVLLVIRHLLFSFPHPHAHHVKRVRII